MMEQLKKILAFLSRHWLRGFIILLVITLILGGIARIIAPPTPEVVTPGLRVTERLAGAVEVTFTGNRELPTQLRLFRGSAFLPSSQIAETLASRLNLSPHPQVPRFYANQTVGATLSQPEGSDIALYTNSDSNSKETVTLQSAQEVAIAFLTQAGYTTSDLKLAEDRVGYLQSREPHGQEEVEADQANLIELFYTRSLDTYPASIDSSPTNTIRMLVTNKGVRNASLISLFFTADPLQRVELLTIDQVLDQIRSGNFLILGTLDVVDPKDPDNALVSLQLTQKQVEYRFDPTQELFIPYVQFSGTTRLKSGDTIPIFLTTPAVKTTSALQ